MRTPERSGAVTFLAVLQLMVGVVLLLGGGLSLFADAAMSSATITIRTGPTTTTRVYNVKDEMEREAPGYKLFLFGGGAVGLLLHLTMIVGAAGLLLLHRWGWWLTVLWGLFQPLYQGLNFVYLVTVAVPACNRVVKSLPRDVDNICGPLANTNTLFHLLWVGFAALFVLYPLLILGLLALPSVRRPFRRRDD